MKQAQLFVVTAGSVFLTNLQVLAVLLVRLPIIILGLGVNLLLILRTSYAFTVSKSDGRPILNFSHRWAWVFGNDHDGLLGDRRGWWDEHAPFGLGADHWFSMWVWSAVRNPANNLRHVKWLSAPVHDCVGGYIGDADVGREGYGWCLTWANLPGHWYRWYGLYLRKQWPGTNRSLYIRLGYKFWYGDIGQPQTSNYGTTFRFHPFKK